MPVYKEISNLETHIIKTELVVIGAGPGGYAAAFLAADLGLQVTLIDPEPNPGGVCLYRGCIPSKTLLHAARIIEEGKHAKEWGITFQTPEIDIERLRSKTSQVVKQLTHGLGQLSRQRKIEYIQGAAKFVDSHTLNIVKPSKRKRFSSISTRDNRHRFRAGSSSHL